MSLFSVVFQDFKLFSLKLGENVASKTAYDSDRVTDALNKAGFEERLAKMPNGLETYLKKDYDNFIAYPCLRFVLSMPLMKAIAAEDGSLSLFQGIIHYSAVTDKFVPSGRKFIKPSSIPRFISVTSSNESE